MDPNTLNLDPDLDPEMWPNLDPDPRLQYIINFGEEIFFLKLKTKNLSF